eukprot:911868-Amphidinium_carterae.1
MPEKDWQGNQSRGDGNLTKLSSDVESTKVQGKNVTANAHHSSLDQLYPKILADHACSPCNRVTSICTPPRLFRERDRSHLVSCASHSTSDGVQILWLESASEAHYLGLPLSRSQLATRSLFPSASVAPGHALGKSSGCTAVAVQLYRAHTLSGDTQRSLPKAKQYSACCAPFAIACCSGIEVHDYHVW